MSRIDAAQLLDSYLHLQQQQQQQQQAAL